MARNRLLWLAPAALALLMSGCAPAPQPATETPPLQTTTAASCTAEGGFLDRRGRLQSQLCVHPFADAGKSCSGDADCQGKCIATPGETGGLPETGQPAKGQCQADDALFGCYAEVEAGVVKYGICKD
ncbi:hypothetical protein [Sphingobium subterraneum]|uniref:Secreted protein n=1 Tax=Sphingobium subterraneum TaxID=627688 RepID=A0A841IWK9_9SPHN|nr:hypothetical protein [Sphingobium subterraneum]MBB6123043.1 hypothetical protein [Sphingobium subterraneum]